MTLGHIVTPYIKTLTTREQYGNIMIQELMILEQTKKLKDAAEDLEKQDQIKWQTKFELLLGAIQGLHNKIENDFNVMEAQMIKEYGEESIH